MINIHTTKYVAVCRHEGCENMDVEIIVVGPEVDVFVVCGPCGQRIDDVTLMEIAG